ncbi:MAG: AmmeMemoRadiSam system protein B [Ignavibacteriaceae bacterium]|nr:AmmeMemoRadiSam system protein B [Ignavibacteriaceae bacterium]
MKVRNPAVAGMFYPAERYRLNDVVGKFLESVPSESHARTFGVVSPHAGYPYSGKTAAYAIKNIRPSGFKRVVVMGPSHHQFFNGSCVYSGDVYRTPLGDLPVDRKYADELTGITGKVFSGEAGHGKEHSIEVILPFLQKALGEIPIVPVIMGNQNEENIEALSDALTAVYDDETLLVASSDLSHFYPRSIARKLDSIVAEDINLNDPAKLLDDIMSQRCQACGGGLIVTMMNVLNAKKENKSRVLHLTDSGEATGDLSEVVGYLSSIHYN